MPGRRRTEGAQGRKVDGYNLGVGNYNTQQELACYK